MKLVLALTFSIGVFALQQKAASAHLPAPTLVELNHLLGNLAKQIRIAKPGSQVFLAGGSARQLIDHTLTGAELLMNDIDVFVVTPHPVSRSNSFSLGVQLEANGLGTFDRTNIVVRRRFDNGAKIQNGLSIFLKNDLGKIDIGLHERYQDIDLNGIFDIDTVTIPIQNDAKLNSLFIDLRTLGVETLLAQGRIVDFRRGWEAWFHRTPTIIRFAEIESDPFSHIVRVVRTFGRLQTPMNASIERKLKALSVVATIPDRVRYARHIVRLLSDENAAFELKTLSDLGYLEEWSLEFSNFIKSLSIDSIERSFGKQKSGKQRLQTLLAQTSVSEQKRLIDEMSSPQWDETDWLNRWRSELCGQLLAPSPSI